MNRERAPARRIISTVIVATGLALGVRGENRSTKIPEIQGDTDNKILQEQKNVYFVGVQRGTGIDKADYAGFACFNKGTGFIVPPPEGKVRSVPLPDGGVILYQIADPEICTDKDHPEGRNRAMFIVYDSNPESSPGFSTQP